MFRRDLSRIPLHLWFTAQLSHVIHASEIPKHAAFSSSGDPRVSIPPEDRKADNDTCRSILSGCAQSVASASSGEALCEGSASHPPSPLLQTMPGYAIAGRPDARRAGSLSLIAVGTLSTKGIAQASFAGLNYLIKKNTTREIRIGRNHGPS